MLSDKEKKALLELLHEQVVPAIGCTEPMAVALCVARAAELLSAKVAPTGGRVVPDRIELSLSANILKNAMGVGIPGTGGMIGLPIAVAMGAIGGKSCLGLEVLRDCTADILSASKQYIKEEHIDIRLETADPDKLYIHAKVSAQGHEAEAIIKGSHTSFVETSHPQGAKSDECCECDELKCLTLRKVYDFATTMPLAVIDGEGQMKITTSVSEALVPKLSTGDIADVSITALQRSFSAPIRSVERAASAQNSLYTVTLSVPEGTEGLLAGMFADVTFHTDQVDNAIVIPSEAILTSGSTEYVYIVVSNTARYVEIVTGLTGTGVTEVLSGLNGGEALITVGQSYVKDGDPVRIVGGAA